MINFTVGPVQSDSEILSIGSEQVPYFRTEEFSNLMLENEQLIKEFINAPESAKVVFITGSGTASMEAAIINTLTKSDKALIVNGGSFGARFVELLQIHEIPFEQIKLETGKTLTKEILNKYNPKDYTSFVVNVHETSTGVHYDLNLIRDFCSKNNLFLIVDAISSFLADEIDFKKSNIDIMITGSQKALACPPGISIIAISNRTLDRIQKNDPKCMYLDLRLALDNAKRGQTPFTPAVGILRQINARLKQIKKSGGAKTEIEKVSRLAEYFRERIKDLPFELVSESPSNAVTTLHPLTANANDIFLILKNEYNIWVCPNGGELKEKIFRVGHIGSLSTKDYDILIDAFNSLKQRKLI
ncbi:alanine--glyoxylate aminotransferase family protein [Candidatus Saccharibacteria bacterium]|nr:alanine--glyoxylate aminotransferase family protein [Candidatus Saccharibacteria bacterium]